MIGRVLDLPPGSTLAGTMILARSPRRLLFVGRNDDGVPFSRHSRYAGLIHGMEKDGVAD